MTTRRVIMLGEAPESGAKGYRSRRLSISENARPDNLPDSKPFESSTPSRTAHMDCPEEPSTTTDPQKWSFVRISFNLMIAILIWTYAISPYYQAVFGTLGLMKPPAPLLPEEVFLPTDRRGPGDSDDYIRESATQAMPLPPKSMSHAFEEDEVVMSEIRTVKSEIHRLQRELNEKSRIHERDPYKDSRDAELAKIHEVIDSLTRRLDVMTEESKLAALQSATTTTTTTAVLLRKPPVNIANGNLGAIIWAERTTYTSTFKRSVLGAILMALPQSKRYQDVKQQVHKWKGPEILLDEQPIRGYGDAYCVSADHNGQNNNWFSVGIKLPYANLIEEIAIEYVRDDLDQVPGLRPKFVKIETFRGIDDSIALEFADDDISFGEDGVFSLPVHFTYPADRLVLKFLMNNDLGACVYRIKVFGAFQKSSIKKL